MSIELDHLFVCTTAGAPEAEELVRFGLREGPPNTHPGQGTACRRFAFANAMLELLWVSDAKEVQSECTRRTLLWQRCSGTESEASPFGICVRPAAAQDTEVPFPAWEYRPAYLPNALALHIGEAGVEEPMWVYLSFMRGVDRAKWFVEHPISVCKITSLTLTSHVPLRSGASQKILESGVLSTRVGPKSVLEIGFDGCQRKETVDFSPHLPLVFQL